MHGGGSVTRQRGFSLIEAIVVLLIASLVLVSVLEISAGAAARNARLSREVSAAADRQLDQLFFRELLGSAMPPLQQEGQPPPKFAGEGNGAALTFTLSPERPVACAGVRPYQQVTFRIVRTGTGGRLLCEGDLGTYPLADWRGGGGRLDYSLDGENWSAIYPDEQSVSFFEAAEDLGQEDDPERLLRTGALRAHITAPIVRFTLPDGPQTDVWMARMGRSGPAPLNRPELFERGGDDGFIDIP
jgi:prepilin-type N-terminal cleavage/methylation domain-containing protein